MPDFYSQHVNEKPHASTRRTATMRFYAQLNDFLPAGTQPVARQVTFIGTPAVKDLIEAQQVPHTEVDLILVNGQSAGFGYRVQGGERISVYPVFERLDISGVNRLRPEPLRHPRFIADVHLGRLARYLRILGLDVLYQNDYADETIIAISLQEHRIILTRDLGILKNGRVSHGYWVRNTQPLAQLREVVPGLQVESALQPFTRCPVCNGQLELVSTGKIWHMLPRGTRNEYHTFYQCQTCQQVFWKGAHYQKLLARFETAGIHLQEDVLR